MFYTINRFGQMVKMDFENSLITVISPVLKVIRAGYDGINLDLKIQAEYDFCENPEDTFLDSILLVNMVSSN